MIYVNFDDQLDWMLFIVFYISYFKNYVDEDYEGRNGVMDKLLLHGLYRTVSLARDYARFDRDVDYGAVGGCSTEADKKGVQSF